MSLIITNLGNGTSKQLVDDAHKHCIRHRDALNASDLCGCFYCMSTFSPTSIVEWIDDGQTALCPFCSVDSVIGSASCYPITQSFLEQMHERFF